MAGKSIISLLGCGWLGLPLAKSLISRGFTVRATTTATSKLGLLGKDGIDPYLVQFSSDLEVPDLKDFFNADILIITIPPARRDPDGFENYRRMLRYVSRQICNGRLTRLILISSTSVYANNNAIVNEFTTILPETESGKLMAEAENLLALQKVQMTSLRLAGLIGPERMPGKFLAGKENIPNGLAPVNLIHLEDVIGIIQHVIEDRNVSGIFNCCAPLHPSREEFYTLAAEIEGLEKPRFIPEKTVWKIVTSARMRTELNYEFRIPSPMAWLHSVL